VITNTGRTYNQLHLPRKYAQGQRRFSVYWAWNYPWEANRDVTELDNRFSTMTEVRRVEWPFYEKPEYAERMFLQGIAGTLELFHLSLVKRTPLAKLRVSLLPFTNASIRLDSVSPSTSASSQIPTR
jgi:hypothetical protein